MTQSVRPEAYGEAVADVYDLMYPWGEGDAAVALMATIVDPGARVVELGVGTGRVAVAAARRGFEVHGIEASPRMLSKLRQRDPQESVKAVLADFTDHVIDGNFDLCYVVCNTLFMLPDPELQLRALCRARDHLVDGGRLLVEAYDPSRFHVLDQPSFQVRHLAADRLMVDTITVDPVNQVMVQVHTLLSPGSVATFTEVSRYAWPAELDLMARLAGLRPRQRWGGWDGSPYGPGSDRHISLYEKPAGS